jgi:signal transduction histidine kinase
MDPRTLNLVIALGNLTFALLVSIFIHSSGTDNRALSMWRWARIVSGAGFLMVWARPMMPWLASIPQVLQIGAVGLELVAYCLYFGLAHRLKTLWWCLGCMLVLQLATALAPTRNVGIAAASLFAGVLYVLMAVLFLRQPMANGVLLRVIGGVNAAGASVLLVRAVDAAFSTGLEPMADTGINFAMYFLSYLALIFNGFGFLLLAKQRDEHELQLTLSHLRAAEAGQRELLSVASHEFRTPAAMIKTSLDSLGYLAAQITPEVARWHGHISHATTRLIDLTNNLISEDRLLNSSFKPNLETVDMLALVTGVLAAYPPDSPLVPDLPQGPILVLADPALLRIALHNLIDNALLHNASAVDSVAVTLTVFGEKIEISIADHGPGIADGMKEKVFDRYYAGSGGLANGLGLSIVRNIVLVHGGDIRLSDNEPHGAVFIIALPRTKETL